MNTMRLKTLLLTLMIGATTTSAQRLLGGDISLLLEYEKQGTVYRDVFRHARLSSGSFSR